MLRTVNAEEVIFYIDLATNFLKKKTLLKAINNFVKEKNKFNALSSYGVVMFQEDDNPLTSYDIKETENLLNTISEAWNTREIKKSFLENGLYEILAYIFRQSQKARKNYRVIIISDKPSKLSEDYHTALYDLLLKAKKFSAFIDVIRVGTEKFYDDDVKLKVISSETQGGTFYCNDEKLFQNILGSLIQNKKEFKVIQSEEDTIEEEDQVFYEGLATELISLSPEDDEICTICELEVCPICEAYSDEIHKCFNCNAKFHSCCAAKYSIAKNIGFKHIFRCPQCDTLLKLDEEFVNMVYKEDLEEELEEIPTIETPSIEETQEKTPEEYMMNEEEQDIEGIEDVINLGKPRPPPKPLMTTKTPEVTKKVKVGGFFGREIEVKINNTNQKVKTKDLEMKSSSQIGNVEKTISITSLKPPRKKGVVKFCKVCGATLHDATICSVCGARIE
jgi:hypothetical protein